MNGGTSRRVGRKPCTVHETGATPTQDELKTICERNSGSWYRDDLVGGFCERR